VKIVPNLLMVEHKQNLETLTHKPQFDVMTIVCLDYVIPIILTFATCNMTLLANIIMYNRHKESKLDKRIQHSHFIYQLHPFFWWCNVGWKQ
jgi:uncharacterized membrane protein